MRPVAVAACLVAGFLGGCDGLFRGLSGVPAPASQSAETSVAPAGAILGQVLSQAGRPASEVQVFAYLTSSVPLTSAAPLNNSSPFRSLLAILGPGRRVQNAGIAMTDKDGRFLLVPTSTGLLNLEAVENATSKAWKSGVTFGERSTQATGAGVNAGTLNLAPTGSLSGRVTAPDAPSVTNFEGVDVFVPGSSYLAKTDRDGKFLIANVAQGSFDLVASKSGLGSGRASGVEVKPNQNASVPDIRLSAKTPSISRLVPADGGPGAEILIEGVNFGASSGETLQVAFAGAIASGANRVDDRSIKVKIPTGATSGDLIVTVAGIPSAGAAFSVWKSVAFDREADYAYALEVGASRKYRTIVMDTGDKLIADPTGIRWSAEESALSVDSTGRVTAAQRGRGILRCASGNVAATVSIGVAPLPTVSTLAAVESGESLAVDGTGNVFVLRTYLPVTSNHGIFKLSPAGSSTLLYEASGSISALANGPNGDVGFIIFRSGLEQTPSTTLYRLSGGAVAETSLPSDISFANGLLFDTDGSLLLSLGTRIARLRDNTLSTVISFMGTLLTGSDPTQNTPARLVRSKDGDILAIVRLTLVSINTTTGQFSTQDVREPVGQTIGYQDRFAVAVSTQGDIYVARGGAIFRVSDGYWMAVAGGESGQEVDGKGSEARFGLIKDMVFDAGGTLYVLTDKSVRTVKGL